MIATMVKLEFLAIILAWHFLAKKFFGGQMVKQKIEYSKAIADRIVHRYINGETIKTICESSYRTEPWFPTVETVYVWLENENEFGERIKRADKIIAEEMVRSTKDVLDDYSIPDSRVGHICKQTQWETGKRDPDKYSDKVSHTHSHTMDLSVAYKNARRRLETMDLSTIIDVTPVKRLESDDAN